MKNASPMRNGERKIGLGGVMRASTRTCQLGVALATAVVCTSAILTLAAQQIADPNFKITIEKPAYTGPHPVVVLDEAHANFHTMSGRYKPFADLLTADGYRVVAGTQSFTTDALGNAAVLVIANALGAGVTAENRDNPPSAFTEAECDAVRDWVRAGGSLFLIADHAPFGGTAAMLARRFGVEMGKGYAWDPNNSRPGSPTNIVYSRENGLLGEHPTTRGVSLVVAFTGQSLSVPPGAAVLMKLSDTAWESSGQNAQADLAAFQAGKPTQASNVGGRAQGLAFAYGRGRVVITGEAGMFSAQLARFKDEQGRDVEVKMGMNVEGNDNRQFLLNIVHWLSRLDEP
jgi:hypothetical protein